MRKIAKCWCGYDKGPFHDRMLIQYPEGRGWKRGLMCFICNEEMYIPFSKLDENYVEVNGRHFVHATCFKRYQWLVKKGKSFYTSPRACSSDPFLG